MRALCAYNNFNKSTRNVYVDDDIASTFEQQKININNYGYPVVLWENRLRPLHCVIYYLKTGIWSKQYETAVHHKNANKYDARFQNLELKDWNGHAMAHGYKKAPWSIDNPNPNRMMI